jgi:hypothetical protein
VRQVEGQNVLIEFRWANGRDRIALFFGVADFTDWEQVAKKPRRTKGMKLIASFSW